MRRLFDVAGAAVFLMVFAPVLAVVAGLVRLKLGLPILVKQDRPGLNGEPFSLVKFRTMTEDIGPGGGLLPDAERMTPFGSDLRSWSLDELPELWSVIKGDMSLVGPRPLLAEYLPLYSPEQARRHDVRGGITGVAQVLDRNDTTWERRLSLDVWYVDHHTFWLDVKIMFLTVGKVLTRSGVSARGETTMSKFEKMQ